MSTKWNSTIPVPKDNYVLRCTEALFGASKRTDNPMATLSFEIVSPTEMEVGGKMITFAGTPLKHYVVTTALEDGAVNAEKTASCQERVKDLFEKFGVDFSGFNPENPDFSGLVGKQVWALLVSDRSEKRRDQTAEQKAKGELGSIIKDPITGKDLIQYFPKIDSFFGEYVAA